MKRPICICVQNARVSVNCYVYIIADKLESLDGTYSNVFLYVDVEAALRN